MFARSVSTLADNDPAPSGAFGQAPGDRVGAVGFGMVLARSCALTAVSTLLAESMQRPELTGRQRGCTGYDDAPARAPAQELRVEPCVVALRGWVVYGWPGTLALPIAPVPRGGSTSRPRGRRRSSAARAWCGAAGEEAAPDIKRKGQWDHR